MSKKILSLFLVLVICFTAVPVTYAVDGDLVTEITDGYTNINGEELTQAEESTTEITTTLPGSEEATTSPETEETTTSPEIEETTTQPVTEETTTQPEAEESTTQPEIEEPTTQPDTPEVEDGEADDDYVYDENEIVANFYVFLIESKPHPIGHTWVYIENLTDRELQVGLYTLPPNEGVSVGVLARADGWGIYYNVESYAQNVHGMGKHISMCDQLTAKKLEKVSKTIINYVNHWDPIFNCMYFAFRVWNSGSKRILLPLLLPVFGKLQMALYSHEFNVQMKPVRRDQTFKQVGFGKFAYLKEISDRSLTVV